MVAKSYTSLDGWKPINNGMFTTYQLVQDFAAIHSMLVSWGVDKAFGLPREPFNIQQPLPLCTQSSWSGVDVAGDGARGGWICEEKGTVDTPKSRETCPTVTSKMLI